MSGKDWIKGLNRIQSGDIPVTLSGGEPTVHKDFYKIVKDINKPMDLLTNGEFNVFKFIKEIGPEKINRQAPYASIRFSYHPGITNIYELISKARYMKSYGYYVGIWAVDHPNFKNLIRLARNEAVCLGIDFRLKEFLGKHKGRICGTYKYQKALDGKPKDCLCKPSELLIAPDGRLFRCHRDLYAGENSYGHLLNKKVTISDKFLSCDKMGLCNPCDIKMKFDRFQVLGHCSVTIKGLNETQNKHRHVIGRCD